MAELRTDKVGLIINPNAKRAKKALKAGKFFWEEFLEESMVEITPNIPAIPSALERLKNQGTNILAVYGGDGTLQRTVTAALSVWGPKDLPPFLVLKGGTANALIKNMGVRKKAKNYLNFFWKLLTQEKLHKVEIFEVPMLKVEDDDTGEAHYGFIFANGLAYRSIVQYQESVSPGAWETFKVGIYPVISRFFGTKKSKEYFKSPLMKVEVDGKPQVDGPVNVVLLSTLKKLILWYAPFSGGIIDTEGFYGIVNYMDLDDLFGNFIGLVRGTYQDEANLNAVLHNVFMKTNEGYMLDGELFKKEKEYGLRVTRAPVPLKVVILPVL